VFRDQAARRNDMLANHARWLQPAGSGFRRQCELKVAEQPPAWPSGSQHSPPIFMAYYVDNGVASQYSTNQRMAFLIQTGNVLDIPMK